MSDMREPRLDRAAQERPGPEQNGPEQNGPELNGPERREAARADLATGADPDGEIAPAYAAWIVDRQEVRP